MNTSHQFFVGLVQVPFPTMAEAVSLSTNHSVTSSHCFQCRLHHTQLPSFSTLQGLFRLIINYFKNETISKPIISDLYYFIIICGRKMIDKTETN
eukprot:m.60028 g.60028  ORF g.60028 m.60028 type:complete len:95 (-) comp11347_c0_seq1:169-453(-)